MEDILASIKRIIAEDGEAAPPPPRVRRGPVAVPDPEPAPESVLPPEPAIEDEPEAEPAVEAMPEEEPAPEAEIEDEPDVLELTSPMVAPIGWQAASILSANAEQASRHAFAALAQAPREEAPRERTIEAFMGEMLRPMLSDWLDRELPAIVERIVTTEVRRISGRG
ncbi:DUF2497 domain-containing protein [Sphingomonas sp.]|uniref:DUF2497 domain-containing protein n=1 Tax=Sphingomonas sp. TaxID=28214 RepID=UPI003B001D9E